METKEYYTPTIEELFIGYECEYKNADKWQGIIIAGIDEKEGILQSTQDSYHWQPSSIRTPYLCKQDIIDLGWEIDNSEILGIDYGTLKKDRFKLSFAKQTITIRIYPGDGKGYVIFLGQCGSKNELKKLMKDYLNIPI